MLKEEPAGSQGLSRDVELARLATGGCVDVRPAGMSRFVIDATTGGAATRVLERVREVMGVVLASLSEGGVPVEPRLPEWFLGASGPEETKAEALAWLHQLERLSPDEREQAEAAKPWPVSSFLYWFESEQREWWWWGAEVRDADNLRVCLVVHEPSFPHEALDWLLRAAGAREVVDENVRALS